MLDHARTKIAPAKIRRAYFVHGQPIKALCRDLGVSRKVVRKVIRSETAEFRYEREAQPLPKIGLGATSLINCYWRMKVRLRGSA
jgi:hypothetical protein